MHFLVSALPLLVLLTFWFVAFLIRAARSVAPPSRVVVSAIAGIVAVFAIAAPINSVLHLRGITDQRGDLAVVRDACGVLPKRADVVVLASTTSLAHHVGPQTLRTWCDHPVAILGGDPINQRTTLARLGQKSLALGHALWVVAGDGQTITNVFPGVTPTVTRTVTNPFMLEQTLLRRPAHYTGQVYVLALARVPTS